MKEGQSLLTIPNSDSLPPKESWEQFGSSEIDSIKLKLIGDRKPVLAGCQKFLVAAVIDDDAGTIK